MVVTMEQEIFRAGVRPGGPTTVDEIKILICYILSKTGVPMSFAGLHESLSEHELVNYFELVAAMDSLEHTGHIAATAGEKSAVLYEITGLGKTTADTIDSLLPPSVRDKAVSSAKKLLRRKKREKEITAEISPCGKGFEVKLSIPENDVRLISFTVFCPTSGEAELLRRRFLNDPAYIYKGVLALLTGDKGVIGEMFPSKEELF